MELNKKLATFVKVQKGSRPSAIRGKSEVIGQRQKSQMNSDFPMAEKRKTRGCLAWEKQNQNQ